MASSYVGDGAGRRGDDRGRFFEFPIAMEGFLLCGYTTVGRGSTILGFGTPGG